MQIDQINDWLSLVANVGVIVGLVLVALQIRQNTVAVRAAVHQQQVDFGRNSDALWLTNPTLAALKRKGESDPESLSPEERETFYTLTAWTLTVWETAWINREAGLVDDRRWKPWDSWFTAIVTAKPGYKAFWSDNRHGYYDGFQKHVDGIIARAK